MSVARLPVCPGTTRAGLPCRASVQRGYRSCPSHRMEIEGCVPDSVVQCSGLTASNVRCRAGAQRGHLMCPQHANQPVGMLPATRETETTTSPQNAESHTTGLLNALLPMTTARGKDYTYLIVGKTEISAFGRSQHGLTAHLLNRRVTAWWTPPDHPGGWRFLRRIEVC